MNQMVLFDAPDSSEPDWRLPGNASFTIPERRDLRRTVRMAALLHIYANTITGGQGRARLTRRWQRIRTVDAAYPRS